MLLNTNSPQEVMAAKAAIHEKTAKGNSQIEVYPLYYQPEEQRAWIYIITNKPNGILYTGVTTNLLRRTYEHKEGLQAGFTKKYGLKTLVYFEGFPSINQAISREKAIKNWTRAWKVRRILEVNPSWSDLYGGLI